MDHVTRTMSDVLMVNKDKAIITNEPNDNNYDKDEVNRLKEKYSKPTVTALPNIDDNIKVGPIIDAAKIQLKYRKLLKENNVSAKNKENGLSVKKRRKRHDPVISDISDLLSTSLTFISPEKNVKEISELKNITVCMQEIMPESEDNVNGVGAINLEDKVCDMEESQIIDTSDNNTQGDKFNKLQKSEKNEEVIRVPKKKSRLSLNGSKSHKNKFKECSQQTKLNGFFKISPTKETKQIINVEVSNNDIKPVVEDPVEGVHLQDNNESKDVINKEEKPAAFQLSRSLFMSPKMKKELKSKIKKDVKISYVVAGKVKHKKKKKKRKSDSIDSSEVISKSNMEDCPKDDFEEVIVKKIKCIKNVGPKKKLDEESDDVEFGEIIKRDVEPISSEIVNGENSDLVESDRKKVHFSREIEEFSPIKINMKNELPLALNDNIVSEDHHASILKVTDGNVDNPAGSSKIINSNINVLEKGMQDEKIEKRIHKEHHSLLEDAVNRSEEILQAKISDRNGDIKDAKIKNATTSEDDENSKNIEETSTSSKIRERKASNDDGKDAKIRKSTPTKETDGISKNIEKDLKSSKSRGRKASNDDIKDVKIKKTTTTEEKDDETSKNIKETLKKDDTSVDIETLKSKIKGRKASNDDTRDGKIEKTTATEDKDETLTLKNRGRKASKDDIVHELTMEKKNEASNNIEETVKLSKTKNKKGMKNNIVETLHSPKNRDKKDTVDAIEEAKITTENNDAKDSKALKSPKIKSRNTSKDKISKKNKDTEENYDETLKSAKIKTKNTSNDKIDSSKLMEEEGLKDGTEEAFNPPKKWNTTLTDEKTKQLCSPISEDEDDVEPTKNSKARKTKKHKSAKSKETKFEEKSNKTKPSKSKGSTDSTTSSSKLKTPTSKKHAKDDLNSSELVEEVLLSPNSGRNAFEFMMDRRHKVIGRNSPGKELEAEEEDAEECDSSELKEKLLSRKAKLDRWNDIKGALKRKLDEADKEICILSALDKRAKRMKKMLKFEHNSETNNGVEEDQEIIGSEKESDCRDSSSKGNEDMNLKQKHIETNDTNIELEDATIKDEDDKEVIKQKESKISKKNKKRKRLLSLKSEHSSDHELTKPVSKKPQETQITSTSTELEEELIELSEDSVLLDETSSDSPIRKKAKFIPKHPIIFDDTADIDVFKKHKKTAEENTTPKVQTGLLSFFGVLKKDGKVKDASEELSFKVKTFSPKEIKQERKRKLSLKKVHIDDSSNISDSRMKKKEARRHKKKHKEKTDAKIDLTKSIDGMERSIDDVSITILEQDVEPEIVDIHEDSSLGVNFFKKKKAQLILEDSSDDCVAKISKKSSKKKKRNKKIDSELNSCSDASNCAIKESSETIIEENVLSTQRRSGRVKITKVYHEVSSPDGDNLKKKKKMVYTDDETSKDGEKKKKRLEESKKTRKVAAVFLNSVPKPKVDPAVLLAKQAFLYSEIPTVLKNKMAAQESMEFLEVDIFPTISHVLQKSESPFWNLPPPNLLLNSPIIYVPKVEDLRFGAITNSQEPISDKIRLCPPLDGLNFKTHLEEIKASNPEYPVYKTFRLLREKNGYRFHQVPKAPVVKPIVKKKGRPKKNRVISDESVEIIENETSGITLTQTIEMGMADHSMWTEKYKPKSSEDIIGNPNSILELRNWLKSWIDFNAEMNKMRKKRRESSDSEFESADECSKDSTSCGLPGNTVILRGPPGSGKTSAMYALCNEFGIEVLELNASSKRTGKRLLHELQEATQSHQVRQNSNPLSTFFDTRKSTKTSPDSTSKMCLLLIEDVDIVFDQDDGFMNALNQLLVTSKRPIALLTTNINCPHLQKFIIQYPIYSFTALSAKTLSTWLQILCLLEGVRVDKSSVGELLEFNKGDVRRTILQLQFWVQSGGEALENIVHDTSISFYRKVDKKYNCFDDYAYKDETSESISFETTPVDVAANPRLHTDCISSFLDMRRDRFSLPFPMNVGNVWWNLPHILNFNTFKHPSRNKDELKPDLFVEAKSNSVDDLNNIFNVFDALSVTDTINRTEEFDLDVEPCSKCWQDNLLDSLEFEENFNDMRSQRWVVNDLTHTLIEGYCKLYKTDDSKSSINMAVPVSDERKWRNKRHECENSYSKVVPLYSALDRAGFSLDYFPTLRTISRTEMIRSSNNQKRGNRFYNYLRTLNVEAGTSTIKTACNVFNTHN